MVSLTAERRLRARAEASDAILGAFRAAAAVLPARQDPLLDRLFALECLLRAGPEARAVAQPLLPARRDAKWYLEQEWEPDVPHLAVLGQATSTIDAAGEDPPAEWAPQLDATATELAGRKTRFGLASSPALIAAVLRGMGAFGLTPPAALLEHVHGYLTATPDPVVAAELAEALARHRAASEQAKQAAVATFGSPKQGPEVATARWWLAERWPMLQGKPVPIKESDVEEARAQALCSPVSTEAPIPAMLAETTGRSIGRLVIVSSATLGEVREGMRRRTIIENAAWRTLFAWCLAGLALLRLDGLLDWFTFRGAAQPTDEALRAAAAAVVAIVGVTTAAVLRSAYRKLGHQIPPYLDWLTGVLTALGGVLAFALYPS